MKKKSKRGGKRLGAGAPKKEDKKETVNLYVLKSVIEKHGGKAAFKKFIYESI